LDKERVEVAEARTKGEPCYIVGSVAIALEAKAAVFMKAFESLLAHPAPGFACHVARDPLKIEGFVAPVAHRAKLGATTRDLEKIPDIVGAAAAREFYAAHDGALLYSGLEIFPIKKWKEVTESMAESWEDGGYRDDRMPYGRRDFIAFAHSHGAASCLHWVIAGPRAGAVYWWAWTMPPDEQTPPLAADFASFIELVCTKPIHFFNELLHCNTRFTDGKTGKEWIPNRYLPDRRQFKLKM